MTTRRDCFVGAAALAVTGATGSKSVLASAPEAGAALCDLVDPFIGAGGHGHTYPGATTPFGMVQVGPDTDNARWDACSGYNYADTSIMGFSHTHLSGTGVGDMMDVLVVPGVGEPRLNPGTLEKPEGSYRSRFDHAEEHASPGDYRVRLKDSGVEVELTATRRVGWHRYRFTRPGGGHLLIDLAHGTRDPYDRPTAQTDAHLELVGDDTLVGSRRVDQWAPGRVIYFALKVSRPFATPTLYSEDRALASGSRSVSGAQLKVVLPFPDAEAAPLLVKVAVSSVDSAGALRNLEAEAPDWAFDAARVAARAAWEQELSRIRLDGGTPVNRRIFYTGLYHAMVAPTVFSDVDGRYRGMDTAIHTLEPGEATYSTYSLWDTYRALHPLFTLISPERAGGMAADLVRGAEQSPYGPPVWPLQGIETHCMIGWHSAVVVAEACAKGLPGVDPKRAWAAFRSHALVADNDGLDDYKRLGFIPSDKVAEAASKTLEYAYDDWALASLAHTAGDDGAAQMLRQRSRNYRNLFDAKMNFMRPRLADGAWAEPFDPRALGHGHDWHDFTECNSWQATFLNQHDIYTYMDMFGGQKPFLAKLDELFTTSSELPPDTPPDIAGLVGQYAHGNEPSHHIAYLYAYAGQPAKTQARVRMLMATMYRDQPDGLAGNEDCGQMSAWYLMSALGLYAVDPVSGVYVFGSPLFPRATLQVGQGRTLKVEAQGVSLQAIYIQSATWNGAPHPQSWIRHADLAAGGRLVFHMGTTPSTFGQAPETRPPSFV